MTHDERSDKILNDAFRMAQNPKMVRLVNFASKASELHAEIEATEKMMDEIADEIAEEE